MDVNGDAILHHQGFAILLDVFSNSLVSLNMNSQRFGMECIGYLFL